MGTKLYEIIPGRIFNTARFVENLLLAISGQRDRATIHLIYSPVLLS